MHDKYEPDFEEDLTWGESPHLSIELLPELSDEAALQLFELAQAFANQLHTVYRKKIRRARRTRDRKFEESLLEQDKRRREQAFRAAQLSFPLKEDPPF